MMNPTRMRCIWTATIAATLTGCATSRLSNDVKPYVGRDIHDLETRLGKPRGRREETAQLIYVWSSDSTGMLATGSGAYPDTRPIGVKFDCSLEVTVDEQNVVQSYTVEGSNAGCNVLRRQIGR